MFSLKKLALELLNHQY